MAGRKSNRGQSTPAPGRDASGRFAAGNRISLGHGRPLGARHKATMAAEALLDGESEALTRKAIELAKDGDTVALRLCLERILPPRKERPVALNLPDGGLDPAKAAAALLHAAADGMLAPGEAVALGGLVELHRRSLETAAFEERLRVIEERLARGPVPQPDREDRR